MELVFWEPSRPTTSRSKDAATSLGLEDADGAPLDVGLLTPEMVVVDIINKPQTPLIAAARKRGCRTQAGEPMVVHQIGVVAKFLTGADRTHPGVKPA